MVVRKSADTATPISPTVIYITYPEVNYVTSPLLPAGLENSALMKEICPSTRKRRSAVIIISP
jgi:hypothetical protein